jgi:hypothetical protein
VTNHFAQRASELASQLVHSIVAILDDEVAGVFG